MPAPNPKNHNVTDIKSFLLSPALTSHFEVWIDSGRLNKLNSFNSNLTPPISSDIINLLKLSCSEASLPGSSLATHELNNDIMGVTQRHAYRRLYDDRADFTFYVTVDSDSNSRTTGGTSGKSAYDQIRYFERWIQFIAGEQIALAPNLNTPYRMKYPKDYKTDIFITKFERTAKPKTGMGEENSKNVNYTGEKLSYTFYNAFPLAINSMPVSYDSSQLLKCTVSFTYDRYIMANASSIQSSSDASVVSGTENISQDSGFWRANSFPSGNFSTNTQIGSGLNFSGSSALKTNNK